MKLFFRIACLGLLLIGTRADDFGFDLADALDDTSSDKAKVTESPKSRSNDGGGLDLNDAFGEDPPAKPPSHKPNSGGGGNAGGGFDLTDAFGEDPPTKPPVLKPNSGGGGGGTIKDSDLFDLLPDGGNTGGGGGGEYKPDGGHTYGGGGYGDRHGGGDPAYNPAYDPNGGGSQQDQGSGKMAGIISAVGVALVGAASSYFAYQKKKLCFKLQGGQDPEYGNRHMTQSEPQVMSNLLQTS